jgi:KUP system potassium uptake protein
MAAVLGFGSSSALAGAYGIAVTLTMLITTLLTWFVVREGWRLPAPLAPARRCSSSDRRAAGGRLRGEVLRWRLVPAGAGRLLLFVLMSTWQRGRTLALAVIRREGLELQEFIDHLDPPDLPRAAHRRLCGGRPVHRAAGTAAQPEAQPGAARAQRGPHGALRRTPWVDGGARSGWKPLGHGFWRVTLHFGFMEYARRAAGAALCAAPGPGVPPSRPATSSAARPSCPLTGRAWRLARAPVRRDEPQRRQRGRVLPPARQRGGRAGHAGADLTRSTGSSDTPSSG